MNGDRIELRAQDMAAWACFHFVRISIKTFQTINHTPLSEQAIAAEKEASSPPIFGSEKGNATAK
jgi:hypothetical protein